MKWALAAILGASFCFAQPPEIGGPYEIGGMVGYGAYRNASVTAPAGNATAGILNRIAAGFVLGEDLYDHLSGEIRYLYQSGGPFVSAGGARGSIQGQSHAAHYDLLIQVRDRESRLRPYFIVGGGIKYYRTTGAPPVQPLPSIVTVRNRHQLSGLGTVGVGARYQLADHVYVRGDFVDYITPFPSNLFQPAPLGTHHGIFHQFTPTVGITFRP